MTAQILRFPGPHLDRPPDHAAQLARDIQSSMAAMDCDIAEFDARARRVRRLLQLRATAKKRLEQQERILRFEKQLRERADKDRAIWNNLHTMFQNPA